ncbi:hypothetical protein DVH24_005298 [Malus domestica]|uniref:Leucine-rich repeat-containing N-terminal plant-type domain-containing protein n=1 Tax=Malus domestica TaxID=3750 RepID=A0A498KPB5_MALDO|nr:hypothetical protein DVH24_005298 [Malus domestica]
MEHPHTNGKLVLFKFLHGFILLCMMSTCPESTTLPSPTLLGNESDRLALLDFKKRITEDPLDVMSSWNRSLHFCSWVGVTCNRSTERVLILNLKAQKLVGSIPPSIGNLTHLTGINLNGNNFHGVIPQQIGRLRSLQYLNLSRNTFHGKIPTNLSHCTLLRLLNIESNLITGPIPNQLTALINLNILVISRNNLGGTIPGWIGNLSSLGTLYLEENNLQGSIPNELGHMAGLVEFSAAENNLSGMVPSSFYNISSIRIFSVVDNQLHGELPPNIGTMLPNLIEISWEYGTGGQVSILGDVYSYGILLLEMFTGKRPTDDMFNDGLSIYQFVTMALPDRVMDIVDPSLLINLEGDGDVNDDGHNIAILQEKSAPKRKNRDLVKAKKFEECLVAVMQIGLSCCAISPRERMLMDAVVRKMSSIRDSYLKV